MSLTEAIKSNTESFMTWLREEISNEYGDCGGDRVAGCPVCDVWDIYDSIEARIRGKKRLVKVWCEYDIGGTFADGHEEVFESTEDAWRYLEDNQKFLLDGLNENFEDLESQGLLTLTVYETDLVREG
uniref:Uncharacterized protein n=1 Tax=Ochrobactrum phage ORM_20 TaxID=2985243 RepID=A0A9N6WS34_9VIRU|nr:hypothetical protein ORM20_00122 [Ochrobactrum phage ORM_20]